MDLASNVQIRQMSVEDVDEVRRIQGAVTQKPVDADFKNIIVEQTRGSENASFVAEHKGKILGFMISYTLSGSFGIEKSAWIAMFGVEPKYMGQGIGKKMAEEIFKYYKKKGITNLYTSVRWDSTDLLSFFKTLGFDRSEFINLRMDLNRR